MHITNLEPLLPPKFRGHNLKAAERLLIQKAPIGEWANLTADGQQHASDAGADPSNSANWGPDREIRAELIRWLCLGEEISKAVDFSGLRIYAAKIVGKLDLSFGNVPFPLNLRRCRFAPSAGDQHDDQHVSADLSYVTLPGLYLDGSFTEDLKLDGTQIKGDVFLGEGFHSAGQVSLSEANIGGSLSCRSGSFVGRRDPRTNESAPVLRANRARVGNLNLRNVSADGDVRLTGIQVAEHLDCTKGKFGSLNLDSAVVKGKFSWTQIKNSQPAILDLTNASVGSITDDEASWPQRGNLFLDGFIYERIVSEAIDAPARLKWLALQAKLAPQPYLQLAKFLRNVGDDDGARQVLFALEKRSRAGDRWPKKAEDLFSEATVGYGIYPGRAIWYACALAGLGWIVHRRAYRMGAMKPTEKEACDAFDLGEAPPHYPPFNPLIYSIENCVPLVKLGQDDLWRADPNPQSRAAPKTTGKLRGAVDSALDAIVPDWLVCPVALRWFRWIMIALGWLLATFFGAAISGMIHGS